MLNALQISQKSYTLSTFPSSNRRNFEDSRKVPAVSVSEFYQSSITVQLYQPTLIGWLSLLYVYNWTTVSVIRELFRSTQRDVLQKKLFCSGYFAGKIDPVLCGAGKMKYICWETFQKLFVKWALSPLSKSLKICRNYGCS